MKQSIKNQLFKNLKLARENDDSIPEEVDVDSVEVEPDTTEGESSVAEAVEDVEVTQEIDDAEDQAEDLDDAAETLDELDVAVETYAAAGGKLKPIEAAALNLTLKQAVARFVKGADQLVGANEDFNNEDQTTLAVESIKETAKEWGEGIVANAKKAIETLKRIISDFINRFRGIEQRAARVGQAAKNFQGGGQPIQFAKVKVAVDGSNDPSAIKEGLDRLSKSASNIAGFVDKSLEWFAAVEAPTNDEQVIATTNKTLKELFNSTFGEESPSFPGGWTVKLNEEGGIAVPMIVKSENEGKGGDLKIPGLSGPEITDLASAVLSSRGMTKYLNSFEQRFSAAVEKLMSSGMTENDTQRREANIDTNEGGGKMERARMIKTYLGAVAREAMFIGKFIGQVNNTYGNVLEFCEKSLQAKGGEAPKQEAPTEEATA